MPIPHRHPSAVAHRGASGVAPENTLAAFRRALEMGADGVELDVHLSSDGVPVVIHDPLLERTTNGRGLVGEHSAEALKRLDAGGRFDARFAGERIPTLAEALDLLRPVRVVIEIKNNPVAYSGIAHRVAAVVREVGHGHVTVSSFDHPVLLDVRAAAPQLPTAVLFAARPVDPVRMARDAAAVYLHPQWVYIAEDLVVAAHDAGLRVEAWTVDDPVQIARIAALGVDGIMSNHPDRVLALGSGRGASPATGV